MTDNEAVLIRGTKAERLGAAPNETWLLADAEHTGDVMTVVRTTLGPGVDGPPPHYHRKSPEMFYLLDGALRVLTGDDVVTVEKGDYLLIPPLMPHAWAALRDTGADVLIVKAPGTNRFDYFRLGDRIRRGVAEPREIAETAGRFDNTFVDNAAWRHELATREGERGQYVPFDR
ncbi:cupin domain-containing protein [Amycolatopsis pithecellobii]|uniref:Cupin domain-containing protein n=1 Tax=Amycolatopsis pithecellobii TaxID=664692 RepID=A0A6N7YZS8_9PSEU|nr:cupin domain-containing protein [Amycolatopsis pithecellobii]MTD53959.1 cupin domain-containing protein [Amycolatopsis pithecellobii]